MFKITTHTSILIKKKKTCFTNVLIINKMITNDDN